MYHFRTGIVTMLHCDNLGPQDLDDKTLSYKTLSYKTLGYKAAQGRFRA
jgi:hypothetical protein